MLISIGGFAVASVAETGASHGAFGASARTLSAGAHYKVGPVTSVGASATLARAEANAGPVGVGVGLSLDTGATVGLDGVGVNVLGFGFHVGPKLSFKTPIADISCCVM